MCPEGRITERADGLPVPLRPGAARIALAAGVPVVCMTVVGADRVAAQLRQRPWQLWRRPRVGVHVGAPLLVSAAVQPAMSAAQSEAAVSQLLHDALTVQVRAHGGALNDQ